MARICSVLLFLALFPVGLTPQTSNAHLLLVLDGLRPDYVTAGPHAEPLRAGTARGRLHQSSRRVSDGHPRQRILDRDGRLSRASRHSRQHASFFLASTPARFLDTAQRAELEQIQADQDGVLLTATTLGEALQANGKTMLAVGAGTSGAAFLLNYKVAGGAIIHTEYALPERCTRACSRSSGRRRRRRIRTISEIGAPSKRFSKSVFRQSTRPSARSGSAIPIRPRTRWAWDIRQRSKRSGGSIARSKTFRMG